MTMYLPGALLCSINYNNTTHIQGPRILSIAYMNLIDTVYVQNYLSTKLSKRTISKSKGKSVKKSCNFL